MGGFRWCSAPNCKNNDGQKKGLSFFLFPKDPERCRKWVIACRRADLINKSPTYLNQNCRLCSEHFENICFLNDLKNRLHTHAVPSKFNIPNPPQSIYLKRKLPTRHEASQVAKKPRNMVEVNVGASTSSTSLDSHNKLESDSQLSSPCSSKIDETKNLKRQVNKRKPATLKIKKSKM